MNYSTLTLTITKEEARDMIAKRVSSVKIREFHGRYEFRSPVGYHLAELSDVSLPNGEQGSQLKYRTAMISPIAAHARSKARQITDAVVKYSY